MSTSELRILIAMWLEWSEVKIGREVDFSKFSRDFIDWRNVKEVIVADTQIVIVRLFMKKGQFF